MNTSFRCTALASETFAPLFELDDAALAARGIRRRIVDARPGYPCRVSLVDADPGDTVLLLPYPHHDVGSPYRASGPIYVRRFAATAQPAIDEVPQVLRDRLLSLRGYDADAMMVAADVVQGSEVADAIRRLFDDAKIRYLQIHNARPGCFACTVERVEPA
jgi:hypothetical protein